MKPTTILSITLALIFSAVATASDAERIPPTDPNIHFKGVLARKSGPDGGLELLRFPENFYGSVFRIRRKAAPGKPTQSKARTTTGVEMLFKTDSDHITLFFKVPDGFVHRGANWRVLQNGKVWKDIDFNAKQRDMTLDLVSATPGKPVVYTVVFPSWSDPLSHGIELDPGKKLLPFTPPSKPLYVAYGDSVSHGTGQRSATYLTWPHKLAQQLGYDFHSLAVGGASIKPEVVEAFKEFKHIDLITFYLGINDAGNKTPEQYRKAYDEALSIIRKYHPKTRIFCITIHSVPEDKKGRFAPLVAYRKPVGQVVAARRAAGDENLFLVKGTDLVGLDGALNPGNVHLSIEGADMWAKNLARIIRKDLGANGWRRIFD